MYVMGVNLITAVPVHFRSLVKKYSTAIQIYGSNTGVALALVVAGVEPRYRIPGSGSNNTSMGSYCVAELGSNVLSIGWETGAVCPMRPVNISILCVKFISKIPFNEFAFLAGYL